MSTGRCALKAAQSFTSISELEQFYNFPANIRGAGQRLAIVEYSGGFHMSDIDAYCKQLGIPTPTINVHNGSENRPLNKQQLGQFVDDINAGADVNTLRQNNPADYESMLATIEVTADITVCAALAGGAILDVYFAQRDNDAATYNNSVSAYTDVFSQILKQPPAVVSLSWSQPEKEVFGAGQSAFNKLDTALQKLDQKGIAIVCASGDMGAVGVPLNEVDHGKRNVHYPASSTHVIAVGGTAPVFDSAGNWTGESVFNDVYHGHPFASGGGYSGCISPDSVRLNSVPIPNPDTLIPMWVGGMADHYGRAVPDVSAFADQTRGVKIVVAGRNFGMGGTSVAAPIWASLLTRIFTTTGGVPELGKLFYKKTFQSAFNDVTRGNNDTSKKQYAFYSATKGWDPCTGLGSPNGVKLLAAIQSELASQNAIQPVAE